MPECRVFVRDLDNHILSTGFTFICPNDQEALASGAAQAANSTNERGAAGDIGRD